MTRLTTLDLPSFNRATVGFDRLFNELDRQFSNSQSQGYPPYNIVLINEHEYMISLAVAGFSMENLDITQHNNTLTIEGSIPTSETEITYLHKGIAGRSFRKEFTLADHVEVESATLELGMLNVHLKREVPDELLPKSIEIKKL